MALTADQLLDSIKRATSEPASQIRLSDDDLLAIADEEVSTRLLPVLTQLRAEYLVTSQSVPVVASQAAYDIPYRAIGRAVRDVKFVDAGQTYSLSYVSPEDSHLIDQSQQGSPSGFFLRGDKLVLTPTPNAARGSLEIFYELRPSKLVAASECARVASVGEGFVVVDSVPSGITTGTVVDLVQARSGNSILAVDASVTNVAGTTLTVSTPSGLAVGDWVCVAETSPVIQLPPEMHQVLAQAVQVRVLEAVGDFEAASLHKRQLDEKLIAVRSLLTPRVRGERQPILNRNGLLGARFARRRRF